MNWTVSITLTYRDKTVETVSDAWADVDFADANDRIRGIVKQSLRKRRVYGVTVQARSSGNNSVAIINQTEWKNQ